MIGADQDLGVSAVTDLLCVIIPSLIIRGLQMDKRTKRALLVVLALGLMSVSRDTTETPLTNFAQRPAACAIGKSVTTEFSSKDITCMLPLRMIGFLG